MLDRRRRSCDIVVELALHIVSAVFAFLISVVLSSGLKDTCSAVSQTQNATLVALATRHVDCLHHCLISFCDAQVWRICDS